MLICDTLNLIGVRPYDRKIYEKEQESTMKKRLLGLPDKNSKVIETSKERTASPIKHKGQYVYSNDKIVNTILANVSLFDLR